MLRLGLFVALAVWSVASFCFAASDGVDDVVKLASSGATEDAQVAYVQNSNVAYNLSIEQILRLNKMGLSEKVVAAMIQRGRELRERAAASGAPTAPAVPPAVPAPPAPAAAGPDVSGIAIPEILDRGAATPAALLESMARLPAEETPSQVWLGFQPPANLAMGKTQLALALQLGARAKNVAEFVQARIGKLEASMVRSMHKGVQAGWEVMLRYQLSLISKDGKVDWNKARITENGDKAEVAVLDAGPTILFARVNGKWYLGDGEGHDSLPKDIEGTKEMTGTLLKILELTEQKIKSGQITKANFIQEYQKLVNENMVPGQK